MGATVHLLLWLVYSALLLVGLLLFKASTQDAWIHANAWIFDRLFDVKSLTRTIPREQPVFIIREDDDSRARLQTNDFRKFHPILLQILSDPLIKVIVFDHNYQFGSPFNEHFAAAIQANRNRVVLGSETSIPSIKAAARYFGHLERQIYAGRVTHVRVARHEDKRCVPSLALRTVSVFYGLDESELICGERVRLGPSFSVRTDESYRLRINYVGPRDSFPSEAYADVIQAPLTVLQRLSAGGRGRIVLVGDVERDLQRTPFDEMSGVEIQANVVDTILRHRYLVELPEVYNIYFLVGLLLLVNVLTMETRRVLSSGRARIGIIVGVCGLLVFVYAGLAAIAFIVSDFWNPIALFMGTIIVTCLMNIVLDRARLLPGDVPVPATEAVSMLSAYLIALMTGRDVIVAFVWFVLTGVVLWTLPRIPRWIGRFAAGIVVFCLCSSVGEASAQAQLCGQVNAIKDVTIKRVGETKRVKINRQARLIAEIIKDGTSLQHGDQLLAEYGVSFRIDWLDKSRTAFEASAKEPHRLEIQCREKFLGLSVRGFVGRILAFVTDGTRMEIIPDDFGNIGTAQTVFQIRVATEALTLVGVEGKTEVVTRTSARQVVEALHRSILRNWEVSRPERLALPDLIALRTSIAQMLRISNLHIRDVFGDERGFQAVARLETSIAQTPGVIKPTLSVYTSKQGDTVDKLIESYYPADVRQTPELTNLIRQEILQINPWILQPPLLTPGEVLVLPSIPSRRGGA